MPPKLPIFLLCSFAIMLVIDTKAFPCHRKAKVSLYWIELKKTRNKLFSTSLQDIVVKQKVSLFIPAPLNGFTGKIASQVWWSRPYMGQYFVFYFWKTLLQAFPRWWPSQKMRISVWVLVNQQKLWLHAFHKIITLVRMLCTLQNRFWEKRNGCFAV